MKRLNESFREKPRVDIDGLIAAAVRVLHYFLEIAALTFGGIAFLLLVLAAGTEIIEAAKTLFLFAAAFGVTAVALGALAIVTESDD